MKPLASHLDMSRYQRPAGPNIRSERDEMVQKFVDKRVIKIHDRTTKQLRLATAGEIALLLKDCPTADLYAFFRECEEARSFSRFFWWAVKGGKARSNAP